MVFKSLSLLLAGIELTKVDLPIGIIRQVSYIAMMNTAILLTRRHSVSIF